MTEHFIAEIKIGICISLASKNDTQKLPHIHFGGYA